jgi:ATP-dependent helicase HrpB
VPSLPVADCLDNLRSSLAAAPAVVLTADTGSGKTTWLPLQLLDEPWLRGKKIIMLEPRRVAARAAAARLSYHLGQSPGNTVGYSIRFDRAISDSTRLEVVTEGILTRRIANEPDLADVGLVIFDEFHERHLDTDLALGLVIESIRVLRPELKILIMSATIDTQAIAQFLQRTFAENSNLPEIPIITSRGTSFPVDVRYLRELAPSEPRAMAEFCARKAIQAATDLPGDVLIFLPGLSEIETACDLLESYRLPGVEIQRLYGELAPAEQTRILQRLPSGKRRIIVATPIAESSITIEGLSIVIDSGLVRQPAYQPGTGLSYLETVPVTQDSAVQRAGRAGRLGPGVCFRMYSEADFKRRPRTRSPEILRTDLSQSTLSAAMFGTTLRHLALPDSPGEAAMAEAERLLKDLGCLNESGTLTEFGRRAASIPLPPRLSVMLTQHNDAATAMLAALLSERDPISLSGPDETDIAPRMAALSQYLHQNRIPHGGDGARISAVKRTYEQILRIMRIQPEVTVDFQQDHSPALMTAYPDRVGIRRQSGSFLLRNGRGVSTKKTDALADAAFLVAVDLDGAGQNSRLRLGIACEKLQVEKQFSDQMSEHETIRVTDGRPRAYAERRLGAIIFAEREIPLPAGYKRELIFATIREKGLDSCLGEDSRAFCERAEKLRSWGLTQTSYDHADLTDSLENWLGGFLTDADSFSELRDQRYLEALRARLTYDELNRIEQLLPGKITLPSGASHSIDYESGKAVVSVRIQEVFGMQLHPAVAEGRLPLTLELLSPGKRPIAVTTDVPAFWKSTYAEVRKEMRGRYPRHFWPEDPLSMQGTTGTKKAFDKKNK